MKHVMWKKISAAALTGILSAGIGMRAGSAVKPVSGKKRHIRSAGDCVRDQNTEPVKSEECNLYYTEAFLFL